MLDSAIYDLVVVGGGLSGSRVVINLLDILLDRGSLGRPLNIAVLDRLGAFGAGVPYGERTTRPGFLLLETVAESTPPSFQRWLRANPALLSAGATESDAATLAWLEANRELVTSERYGELFVPRRLFGAFVKQELQDRVLRAGARGLVSVTLVAAEARDIHPGDALRVETAGGSSYLGRNVTLAMGCVPSLGRFALPREAGYIHEPYADGFETLHAVLLERARTRGAVDVVILGSGASASEVIYYLAHAPDLIDSVGTIHVVSSSGSLAGSALSVPAAPSSDRARPSAREYVAAATRLSRAGKLFIKRGWLGKAEPLESSRLRVYFRADGERSSLEADVIVNCAGPGTLEQTSSPLLRNLASPGRPFRATSGGEGFVLKPNSFEVDGVNGCFVIGPLLNQNPGAHVESIHAVYRVADQLAQVIYSRWLGQLRRPSDHYAASAGSK